MAGSSNFSYNSKNPFLVDDDVDDAAFLRSGNNARSYEESTLQERREQLLAEKRKIEERTVQSSFRSISLLQESEHIGNVTAQELTRQREQLENTEQKLDVINDSLRKSQKHIQGIKSVFGSIKNYFAGNGKPNSTVTSPTASGSEQDKTAVPKSRSDLSQILENQREPSHDLSNHPVMRFRSESTPTSKDVDTILDQNLEEMGNALSRLKGLGLGLQDEIVTQNDVLDRIGVKTERADIVIQKQNKEMNRILKK